MSENNIDNIRSKLNIIGYEHPSEIISQTRDKQYMTYTEKSEGDLYKHKNTQKDIHKKCPECGEKAMYECDCEKYMDKECKNGHIWYKDSKGHIIKGDPHANES